jgi:hypothetical protein
MIELKNNLLFYFPKFIENISVMAIIDLTVWIESELQNVLLLFIHQV